jgi:hypothetical protein
VIIVTPKRPVDSVAKLAEAGIPNTRNSFSRYDPSLGCQRASQVLQYDFIQEYPGGLQMSFFAIQVVSGREDAYIEFFSKQRPDQALYNIKKTIRSRKKGKPTW